MNLQTPARSFAPGIGVAVAHRTICRRLDPQTRIELSADAPPDAPHERETWAEVAERVAVGNSMLHPESADFEFTALNHHLRQASVLMSGRHLQHGDASQPGRNQEIFTNCSTAAARFLLFYLLLNGSGVGTCYDNAMQVVDYNHMPIVVTCIGYGHGDVTTGEIKPFPVSDALHLYAGREVEVFEVPDSREGWAKAIERIDMKTFERKRDCVLILDFSIVRQRNSPIKGMQNRPASGPGPLMNAIVKLAALRDAGCAPWRAAMYADHYLAECVLVGGARRAARMAAKTWRDHDVLDFVQVKRGGFLWSSNNSVTVDEEFWKLVRTTNLDLASESEETKSLAVHAKIVFEAVCHHSYHDQTGEPGLINVDKLEWNDTGVEVLFDGEIAESSRYKLDTNTLNLTRELVKAWSSSKYKVIVNPCAEIVLNSLGGYCVIADVVPYHSRPFNSTGESLSTEAMKEWDDDAEDAFRAATRALIRTNLMDCLYAKEVKRTNRIGVGMTGVHEYAWARFGYGWRELVNEDKSLDFWQMLSRFSNASVDESSEYSAKLGVVAPHTVTTEKPSGTVSKLFSLSEGVHLPSMREYLRWVQFRNGDPLIAEYKAKGYPTRELQIYAGTTIVGFPTSPEICTLGMGDKLVTAAEATPEEQYQWLRLLEKYWIDGHKDGKVHGRGNQISYCLAGEKNHLIPTSTGLQRIEGMTKSFTNDRFGQNQGIIDLVDNGVKPTTSVTLKNGAKIIGTVDHKLLTLGENLSFVWKKIGDFDGTETVVRRVGDNQWSTDDKSLPPIQNGRSDGRAGHYKNVTAPTIVSPDFALFVGMLMSDGSITENGIALTTDDSEVANTFTSLAKSLFGIESSVGTDRRAQNLIVVQASSRALSRWLIEIGIHPSHDDHFVPEFILRSSKACIEQFVRGYTLDGFVTKQGNKAAVCTTVSETMARDLCAIMWNLGFDVSLGHKGERPFYFSESNRGMGKAQYQVVVPGSQSLAFVEQVGFLEARKNEAVRAGKACSKMAHKSNSVPAELLQGHYTTSRDIYAGDARLRGVMKAKSKRIAVQSIKEHFSKVQAVEHLLDEHLRFTEVASVEVGPVIHTYDITVDVSHEYVANSVVVHNTLKYDPKVVSYETFRSTLLDGQSTVRACSVIHQIETSAYEYTPEEIVDSERYAELVAAINDAEMKQDIGLEHVDCASGACPIDFRSDK